MPGNVNAGWGKRLGTKGIKIFSPLNGAFGGERGLQLWRACDSGDRHALHGRAAESPAHELFYATILYIWQRQM